MFRSRWTKFGLLALLVGAIFVWYVVIAESRTGLSVYVFDVGQGDSIFVDDANGNQILIDGGPDSTILTRLGTVMPFYDHSIDMLILTHPHADHVDGLVEVLKRYRVGQVIESGAAYPTPAYQEWHRLLIEKHIPVTIARAGEKIIFDTNGAITVLAPLENDQGKTFSHIHDSMIVSRLDYGGASMLLTGDMEASLEKKLIFYQAPLDADILKVGHHGSKTSSSDELLAAVSPKAAIISVGKNNRYGHPNQEVVDRLNSLRIPVYRTDTDGTIVLHSNGGAFTITK